MPGDRREFSLVSFQPVFKRRKPGKGKKPLTTAPMAASTYLATTTNLGGSFSGAAMASRVFYFKDNLFVIRRPLTYRGVKCMENRG